MGEPSLLPRDRSQARSVGSDVGYDLPRCSGLEGSVRGKLDGRAGVHPFPLILRLAARVNSALDTKPGLMRQATATRSMALGQFV